MAWLSHRVAFELFLVEKRKRRSRLGPFQSSLDGTDTGSWSGQSWLALVGAKT